MSRRRLVIAGGGVAGLLAAAAARDEYREVIVLEAALGSPPTGRRGAQCAQLHNVLSRGQRQLEDLLPGFRSRILELGAVEGSVADDTHVYEFGGSAVERPLGLSIWSASWQMFWDATRSLLPSSIEVRFGCRVNRLLIEEGEVCGVQIEDERSAAVLAADAVVDATGYTSQFGRLLAAEGVAPPDVTVNLIDRWFVTHQFERPPAWVGSNDFWMVFTDPPERHVALVSPLHHDRWVLSVSSQAGQNPPRDLSSVLSFLDTLPGRPLRPILEEARPIGGPEFFRRKDARWRHYENADGSLRGLVPLGDAYAALNPVFGQGLSIAAWQASVLRRALRTPQGDVDTWSGAYLAAASDIVGQCWMLDQVPVPLITPQDWATLATSIVTSADLQRRYVGLWHLLEPPENLRAMCDVARGQTSNR